jgi:hypothetical protein
MSTGTIATYVIACLLAMAFLFGVKKLILRFFGESDCCKSECGGGCNCGCGGQEKEAKH